MIIPPAIRSLMILLLDVEQRVLHRIYPASII